MLLRELGIWEGGRKSVDVNVFVRRKQTDGRVAFVAGCYSPAS